MATNTKGKVIETIKHWSQGLEFVIQLRLAKDRDGQFIYKVWFDEWGKGFEGPEPNAVIRDAKALIDDKTTITWETFLWFRTEQKINQGHDFERPTTAGVLLSVSQCLIGTSASGRKVHMFVPLNHEVTERTYSRFSMNDGVPTACTGTSHFDHCAETSALIPATDDNIAKARALLQALDEFSLRLVDLMGPDKAQGSLGSVVLPTLLKGPDESAQH